MKRQRVLAYVTRMVMSDEPSRGFGYLKDGGRIDLVVEVLVADPVRPWHHLFDQEVIDAAQARLAEHGYEVGTDKHEPAGLTAALIPTEAGYGSSTFAMPVTPWLQTTVPGLITGGILAFLADGPLGTAIMTVLPPLGYTTLAPKPEHYHDIMVIQGTEKHLVRFKKSGPAKVDATAPAEDAQESN